MAVIEESKKQFQIEQNQLLKTVLNYRFFYPWQGIEKNNGDYNLQSDSGLEIYITPNCNQQCSYCYLHKHPELYPKEITDNNVILNNLQVLYNYIIENDFYIPQVSFFSGEIWHEQFGWNILEITLQYIKQGMKFNTIIITSNGSFVNNSKAFYKIQSYITAFKQLNCQILFSFSIDGAIIDNISRPRLNGEAYTDEFYDKLFTFAKENHYLFHPMISAENVSLWIENFKWWKKKIKEYNFDRNVHNMVMMLEVRNDNWTDETIEYYCNFITYLMNDYLNDVCQGKIEIFANAYAGVREFPEEAALKGYFPWIISKVDTFPGCTITNNLTVRLGDLAICPCHRTSYEQYLYGHFIVKDRKIIDIEAQNPQMAIYILMSNLLCAVPICDSCKYNKVCLHGCYGSQLETMHDPMFPIKSVCKLFDKKYKTIFTFLRDKGILDYYKRMNPQEEDIDLVSFILCQAEEVM